MDIRWIISCQKYGMPVLVYALEILEDILVFVEVVEMQFTK